MFDWRVIDNKKEEQLYIFKILLIHGWNQYLEKLGVNH